MLPAQTLLLTTKLYCPPQDANGVARPELLARLNEGLRHKLTLISAPAGFGKSTLVSQWIQPSAEANGATPTLRALPCGGRHELGMPVAWLSLDEGDNRLAQFLRYLIAAVQTCVPAACSTTQSLLTAAELPNADYLADLLTSELTALPADLVLVLDDYHLIKSSAVHQVMRHLLRYLPPTLHLVLVTRADPPLFLGRLRIAGQITELRARDLRFAPEETHRFLQHRLGQALADDMWQTLHLRTEGWVTGLQLASISLQSQDPDQFLAHFRGTTRLLTGYLMEEVMAQLPDTVRTFLVRTAIAERFCAPLADAILADSPLPGSSQVTIDQLEAQNLFIIPLDQEGDWYRYHDLFRDFLRHQLKREEEPASLARLHQRASAWLAAAGLIEDALRHALAAGDEAGAAELVETHLPLVLNQQAIELVLARWLDLFAEPTISTQLGPLMVRGVLWAISWQHARLSPLLVQIETLLKAKLTLPPERRQFFQALLALLQGMLLFWRGATDEAKTHLLTAQENLAPVHLTLRAQTTIYLAWAYLAVGEPETSFTLLRGALAEATIHEHFTSPLLLGAFILNHLYLGELAEAAAAAQRVLLLVDAAQAPRAWQGVSVVEAWRRHAYFYLGLIAYEHNDLETAIQYWRQLEAPSNLINFRAYHESLLGLALIAHVRGSVSEALAYAQAARELAERLRNATLLALSEAFEVRLALMSGNMAEALHRAQAIETTSNEAVFRGLVAPRLSRLHVLLAEATPAALTAARQLAESALHQAEKAHNIRQIIQITALHGLVLHALRRNAEACAALERALTLAEPGGFMRTFLDLGQPLAELLCVLALQRRISAYGKRLLVAFTPEQDSAERYNLTAQYAKLHGITPLTLREIELLTLIKQGLSLEESAATLVISPNTVKKHTHNIYTKLGVRNSRQALAKAQELGFLGKA